MGEYLIQSNFRGIPNTLKILMGWYSELSQILGVYPTLRKNFDGCLLRLSQISDVHPTLRKILMGVS